MAGKSYGSKNYGKDSSKESLDKLKEQLKTKTPARIYLFHGNEPFLIDYYVGELKKLILEGDSESLNLSTFENSIDIDDIIDACDTFPVFAERKLVIVKNSGLFYSKSKKNSGASSEEDTLDEDIKQEKVAPVRNKTQEALIDYIPDIPETTCLIFIESQADKRLKAYKQVTANGISLEFNRNKPSELVPWVIKGMKSLKKAITHEAAQHLVAISESDMYTLRNEIFKLADYVGDRKEVSLEDVKLMAIPTIKSVIFDLLDAVAKRDISASLNILNDIIALKEPEQKILAMLSKQTGEILKLKLLLEDRATQTQINQYFQGKHPYALKIMTEQARRMDVKYLKSILKNCMKAEEDYKKGLIEPKLALELLLEKISV
ncbi:MAG: DNA polymerase III subunit delta [Acetivibrionales bacterium]|jgi:DNA polymerase-3 subunit delta|nr:DNA polymerase III subunit delta [Clostridiaceae bacterium]